ncbi:hypothetical protein SYNPS1DRAFT_24611, partial [Syncephalis pseudoplumigaleata]
MSNTKADLKRAKEAIAAKRYQDALRICEGILLFESLNINARVMAGAALFQLEQYDKCEEALKRALDSQPDSAVAWQGLVNLYERQHRQEELANALEQLLGLYIKSGNGARLLELLNKLRAMREKEGDPSAILAVWQLYLPDSPYWSAIASVPEKPPPLAVWRAMMEIQEAQDRAYIAREIDARKRRLGAGTPVQIKAQVMTDIQSTSKLEDYYEQVLALEPDEHARLAIEAAYLERLADRLPVAPVHDKEKLLEKHLELDDGKSDIGRAYRWYLDWIATDAITDESFKQLLIGVYTGTEALEIYEAILVTRPDHTEALFGKGSVLQQQGRYEEARAVLEQAHQLDPERADIMTQLGWTMHQLGDSQQGIDHLTASIEHDPQARSYLLLGKLYWELQ